MYIVIAPIPEDLAVMVKPYRQKYDPMANVIAPHVSVITPFQFSGLARPLIDHLITVGETHAPIKVSLVGWHIHKQQNYFQLRLPIVGGKPEFVALREHMLTGPLANIALPDESYWPHIGFGQILKQEQLGPVRELLKKFQPKFVFRVRNLQLLHRKTPTASWQPVTQIGLEATMASSRRTRRSREATHPLILDSLSKDRTGQKPSSD